MSKCCYKLGYAVGFLLFQPDKQRRREVKEKEGKDP